MTTSVRHYLTPAYTPAIDFAIECYRVDSGETADTGGYWIGLPPSNA